MLITECSMCRIIDALEGVPSITIEHISEVINYHGLDRESWGR